MNAVDQVLRFFGEVVLYGGGSATVAYFLFRHLGQRWIEAKFAERLEAFKHEQAKELQRLKVEVESLLSGALKIQDREFTVLPEAWHKLNEAYSLTAWVVSPIQQYPDVSRMADDELEEFLATSELLETQRARVARKRRSQQRQNIPRHHFLASPRQGQESGWRIAELHGLSWPLLAATSQTTVRRNAANFMGGTL